MKERRIELSFWLGLLWLVALSYLCFAPITGPSVSVPYMDKIGHFFFFFLGGLSIGALPLSQRQLVLAALLLMACGGLLEVLQGFTDFRRAEWADLLADGLGAAVGVYSMAKMTASVRAQAT
ncbi:MAG: VanZ family protein [Oceanococcus sp.]